MKVDAATLAGGSRNQDVFAAVGQAVILLDGASAYPSTTPDRDGGWYARALLAALIGQLQNNDDDLRDTLAGAIASVRDSEALTEGGPSSTVLIARVRDDVMDLLVLGDSTMVVEHTDGRVEVITDARLAAVATAERRAYRDRLQYGGGFDTEHAELLAHLQERQRAGRNRVDGYWIAEADPDAARHAITCTIPVACLRRVLLLTDGAAAGVARYRQPETWVALVQQVDQRGAAAMLAAVQAVEDSDPNGQRWPRSKPHDDKTAALIQL